MSEILIIILEFQINIKMKNRTLFSVVAVSIAALFYGQQGDITPQPKNLYPSFVEFTDANAPAFVKGKFFNTENAKVGKGPEAQFLQSDKDKSGYEHYRFQQTLNGYPIEGAFYIQHVQNGKLMSQNGVMVKDFSPETIDARAATLQPAAALESAKRFVGAREYKWEIASEEEFLKRETGNPSATFLPKGELVYYNQGSEFDAAKLRLAYKFDIYANAPASRKIVYVDAKTGEILGTNELIKTLFNESTHQELLHNNNSASIARSVLTNATGSAATAYSGTQAITTDYTGSTYRLRETGRGNGIETYNLKKSTSYSAAVDFTDADNTWNNVNTTEDQYATDAHWGSEKVYDYYKNSYGRNGIDGSGMKMLSYVHYSSNYLNAYWDGSRMTYGDGDSSTTPLTSLDIVGHEMTHGITERTSNLAYRGESGALNEAYSDILGVAVEFAAKPSTANWLMGDQIGMTFRSMSNPNQYQQPDTYKGTYWYNTVGCTPSQTTDQCGVHTNSGVLNYWFYLLTNGGSGTNDINNAFSVSGLGIVKAAAIAYRTNTNYLGSSSTYADARTYSIKSAEDLYGVGSNEANQVMNAFYAVGIGAAAGSGGTTSCVAPSALASSAITQTTATVSWGAVSGSTGYTFEYKPSTLTTWTATTSTATSRSLTGLTAGTTYDIRVKNNCSTTSSSAYTTSQFVSTATTGSCSQNYESNNTVATAYALSALNTDYNAAIQASGDIDWYKITFSTGGQITFKLSNLAHDVDLKLFSSDGTTTLKSSLNAGTTAEKIQYTVTAGTYYIKVYPYSGFNATSCYALRVESGYTMNGINGGDAPRNNDLINDEIKLYPNPATDYVTVSLPEKLAKDATARIFDMSGNLKMTTKMDRATQQINVSTLNQGIYIIKIETYDEPVVLKFIKK